MTIIMSPHPRSLTPPRQWIGSTARPSRLLDANHDSVASRSRATRNTHCPLGPIPTYPRRNAMLSWALTFLIIAIVAAVLGFGGIAGTAAGIAKILFVVFLVLFVISFVMGRRPRL